MYKLTEYLNVKSYKEEKPSAEWEFHSAQALKEKFSQELYLFDTDVQYHYLGIPQKGKFFLEKAGLYNKNIYYRGINSGRIWTFEKNDDIYRYTVEDLIFAIANRIKEKDYSIRSMCIPYICFYIKAYYAMHKIDICNNDFYINKNCEPKCKKIERFFVGGAMSPFSWEFNEEESYEFGEFQGRYYKFHGNKFFFKKLNSADKEIVNQIVDEFANFISFEILELFEKTKLYGYLKENGLTENLLSFDNMKSAYEQIEKSEG